MVRRTVIRKLTVGGRMPSGSELEADPWSALLTKCRDVHFRVMLAESRRAIQEVE